MGARSGKQYPKPWPSNSHLATRAAETKQPYPESGATSNASQAGMMPFSNGTVPDRPSKKKGKGRHNKHRCHTLPVMRISEETLKNAATRSLARANARAASEAAKLVDAARSTQKQTKKETKTKKKKEKTKAVPWLEAKTEILAP